MRSLNVSVRWRSTLVNASPTGKLAPAATALPGLVADGGAPGVAADSCPERIH